MGISARRIWIGKRMTKKEEEEGITRKVRNDHPLLFHSIDLAINRSGFYVVTLYNFSLYRT